MSRVLFTHSLPLVAAEQCYQKLLNDARELIINTKNDVKKEEVYQTLLHIIKKYNDKLLSTKVYWENSSEREKYKKFLNEYNKAESDEQREIAILKRELYLVKDNGPKTRQIRKFYKHKLIEFGVMKILSSNYKKVQNIKFIKKSKIKEEI